MPGALSIAQPLRQELRDRPFVGRVMGRYQRACNLIDDQGRVIALTLPSVGNGPFFIVLAAPEGLFETLDPHQPVRIDADLLLLGDRCVSLRPARTWDPKLPQSGRGRSLPSFLAALLRPYSDWPPAPAETALARATARLLAEGAQALSTALRRGHGQAEAAARLAGLGAGLTPAGDDYLLGVMAALWLQGEREALTVLAQAAAPRTTALSAAFLTAAAQGQFAEPWHALAHALQAEDEPATRTALERIAATGASSGRDALAGFAMQVGASLIARD